MLSILLIFLVDLFGGASGQATSCPPYSSYSLIPHAPYSNGSLHLPYMRPSPGCRTFNSTAVESVIAAIKPRFKDPDLARLFENAFSQTLDTTVKYEGEEVAFLVTGDIDAEWLRDTYNQINVYADLIPYDPSLQALIKKVLALQARYISQYPFCGSFQPPAESGLPPQENSAAQGAVVQPPYDPSVVFECKFEIDSLAGFLALSTRYYSKSNDTSFITAANNSWVNAVSTILDTLESETSSTLTDGGTINSAYNFTSDLDVVINSGVGPPQLATGMVGTSFRPSDDKITFRFNIPDNAMISVNLASVVALLGRAGRDDLATRAQSLSSSIKAGIDAYGIVEHPRWGRVYAYEVDGYGSAIFMDDANVPSLLSLPILGYTQVSDETYQRTRKMILNPEGNPYYNVGPAGAAIGSPHTGIQHVWPMSLITQILTATSDEEIMRCLSTILTTTSGLGLIHESFNVHDASEYTRQWFAWANSYFSQMILTLAARKPALIFNSGLPFTMESLGRLNASQL